MKALEQLSEHKQLLEPAPVETYKAALDRRWKALGKEVSTIDHRVLHWYTCSWLDRDSLLILVILR